MEKGLRRTSHYLQHGPVAARVENGIIRVSSGGKLRERLGVLPEALVVLEECLARSVRLEHLYRGRVEGSNASLGRSESELCTSFDEGVVRVCELRLWEGTSSGVSFFGSL